MKVLWLFRSRLLWIQQRHGFCTFPQRCSPYIENHTRFRGLWMGYKRKKPQRAFSLEFSTKINNEVDTPVSATEQLANLNEKQKEQLEQLKVEVEIMRAYGSLVPEKLTDEMWLRLIEKQPSASALPFILKRFYYEEKSRRCYEETWTDYLTQSVEEGVFHTFQPPVSFATMDKHFNNNLCYAMMHEPTVIIDMEFEDHMGPKEIGYLSSQIRRMFLNNQSHPEPFHLHFCGLKRDSVQYRKIAQTMEDFENLLLTVSEEPYIDLYPKQNLVYLSPDAREVMKKFKEDEIYILGGHFDKGYKKAVTATKARQQGVRHVKLPLDKYLRWGPGAKKSLLLHHVMAILLDLRRTRDWHQALSNIPSWKLKKD